MQQLSSSFGFKSVLGGGYQSLKPDEIKMIKGGGIILKGAPETEVKTKYLTPLR